MTEQNFDEFIVCFILIALDIRGGGKGWGVGGGDKYVVITTLHDHEINMKMLHHPLNFLFDFKVGVSFGAVCIQS
jgi:hypothetical protein